MKNTQIQKKSRFTAENVATAAFVAAAFLAPAVGMAADDFTSASGGACKFIKNIHTVLNLMSVAVVTIRSEERRVGKEGRSRWAA